MTARRHQVVAQDGHRLDAWVATPTSPCKGGIVVLHAVYGLTDHIGAVCERWAAHGYAAVAPALYDRIGPNLVIPYETPAEGTRCFNALSEAAIYADITAAADHLGGIEQTIISGFCTGGTWAWRMAARVAFRAQVNFYGSAVPSFLHLSPRCPTIMHYGTRDHVVSRAQAGAIHERHPEVEMHMYEGAGHAFENSDQPTYDRAACDLAWQRSVAFLDKHRPIT